MLFKCSVKLNYKTEFTDFFESPGTFQLLKIFIINGGYWNIIAFIILTTFAARFLVLYSEYEKTTKEKAKTNGETKHNIKFKDLNIMNNCIVCIKLLFKNYTENEINNLDITNCVVLVNIFLAFAAFAYCLNIFVSDWLISKALATIRYRFFDEFINKVEISYFLNPQQCIKYLDVLFNNIGKLFDFTLAISRTFVIFLVYFFKCLDSRYTKWNIILIIWLIIYTLIPLLCFLMTSEKDIGLELSTIENGYILNIEMQKIFNIFSNNKQKYKDLLSQDESQNLYNNIIENGGLFIGWLSQALMLGYGLIFFVLCPGGLHYIFPALILMIENFQYLLWKFGNMFKTIGTLTKSYYHFKCDDNYGDYFKQDGKIVKKYTLNNIESIEFRNATYHYKNSVMPEKLKNLNFFIKKSPGKTTAILLVGKFGDGKTTIARLFLGLYNLISGQILINGIDLRQINKKDLYSKCIISLQFSKFLRMSIKDTIESIINPQDKAKVDLITQKKFFDKVVKESGLSQFIDKWPEKENTLVVDGAEDLSGGTKKVVDLAKFLLLIEYAKKLQSNYILGFLDEIVASLDHANAIRILDYIFQFLITSNIMMFFTDHTGLIYQFMNNPKFKNLIDFQILFFSKNGLIFDSLENMQKNQEFQEYMKS